MKYTLAFIILFTSCNPTIETDNLPPIEETEALELPIRRYTPDSLLKCSTQTPDVIFYDKELWYIGETYPYFEIKTTPLLLDED